MGGQACILYGASEFSRDTDIALLASNKNLELLKTSLRQLQAHRIALPPFDLSFLQKGHAVHFRCFHPDAMRIRVDVMSVMRNVDRFEKLWQRRVSFQLPEGGVVEMLSIQDLVRAKKTQRDKDWPMIRRLIEADYVKVSNPSEEKLKFWLLESRTPAMLIELSRQYRKLAQSLIPERPLISLVTGGSSLNSIEDELEKEQKAEREADKVYWKPLLGELEKLRLQGYSSEEIV